MDLIRDHGQEAVQEQQLGVLNPVHRLHDNLGNDTVTGGGNDDKIFKSVVKSSQGDRWEFCLSGR